MISASSDPDARVTTFAAELAAGRYFEAHEVLEELWQTLDRSSDRALALQGLIQGAVALEHLRRGRPDRACRLARKALPKLEGRVDVEGFDPDPLRRRLIGMIVAEQAPP